jgi:hypothetical protein
MEGPAAVEVRLLLRWFKEGPPGALPVEQDGRSLGCLLAVTWEDAGDPDALGRLARWHGPGPATPSAARRWLVEQVLSPADRVLFWVKDVRGDFAGRAGLGRLDFAARTAAVCDVASAGPGADGLVRAAALALAGWARTTLGLDVAEGIQARAA